MKIAVLTPIELSNAGGVEAHILQLNRSLRKLGADVHIFGKTAGDDYLPFRRFVLEHYDVIHTHGSIFSPRFIPLAMRMLPDQRHVHTLHGVSIDYLLACHAWLNWQCYTSTAVEGICSLAADHVIAVSESVAGRARQWFRLAADKITVIPNGFTPAPDITEQRQQARNEFKLASDHRVLLFVGRGDNIVKGTDTLTEAMTKLYPRYPHLRLLAVPGNGFPHAPWLCRSGPIPLTDMARCYAAADIYINASRNEGMPLTIIEALGSSLPVIASPVGGIPEIITCGYNGLLLNPERTNLAERIEQLILDTGLRQSLAHNAPQSVANLTWDHLAQRTLTVYEKLCNSQPA